LREFVDPVEIFSALLSGLAHDLNHKGVNNGYKIKKSQKFNIITSD
jgi:cAMP-specific phosphodiesterase 4